MSSIQRKINQYPSMGFILNSKYLSNNNGLSRRGSSRSIVIIALIRQCCQLPNVLARHDGIILCRILRIRARIETLDDGALLGEHKVWNTVAGSSETLNRCASVTTQDIAKWAL